MNDFIPPAKPLIGDEERAAVDRVMRSGMLAQGPEVAAFEQRVRRALRARPRLRGGQLGHLGPAPGPALGGRQARRRGHRPVVHLRRDRELGGTDRRHAGLRRHRPRLVLPRPGQRRGGHHRPHRRRSCRCISTATRPTWPRFRPIARPGTACRSSRTPLRHTAPRSTARRSGAFGSFAMFSLYPTKNMTSGEGGMVSVANDEIERLMRLYRNQGMQRQYENEVVGFNNRMTDIHAAIGRVQLTKVDAWTKQRQENAAFLDRAPRGRHDTARRRGRGARLPPVHGPGPRGPRRPRRAPYARSTTSAPACSTRSRTTGWRRSRPTSTCPTPRRAARECLSLPVHPSVSPRRPGAHRDRRQHARQGRCLR